MRIRKGLLLYKSAVISTIGVFLLTASVIPVRADDLHDQLNQSQRQLEQLNGTLSDQKDKVATATAQVLGLKQSVQALNSSIAREQTLLNQEQGHLKDLEDQQAKLEDQRQEHVKALGQFLKNNYEDGVSTYIAVLLDATSLSDFIDRADKIQMIVGTYSKLQNDLAALNSTLDDQKKLINQKKATIQTTLQEKTQTQQSVQQALDKQQVILAQLSSAEKETLNQSLNTKAKVNRIQQLIQQQELEAANAAKDNGAIGRGDSGGVSGTVAISGGAKQVLGYASQFLGIPYVWGGTTPSPGFDCSGYVQYVYRHFGISLSRTSEQQFNNGVAVSRSNLQPGDLVFFHTYASDASHVGIYVGNNTMINSSNGGVSYDDMTNSYWSSRYLGARRVIAQ
ncbi:NlpC/P60 family protein [Desulfosporosinus sp. PR]|uniref:C40 family peptidase n=1 Tax=Candidatus Desulfosporosinus nitrosoreducens TaxID=3401928 RepID=UPI0027FD5217|nr:NlpC/P60 family protein [Desulfosporosinus sp. PR]MDQ7093493.1 NlpC/P60 family protein [Desulfosporosinus sp. PR]